MHCGPPTQNFWWAMAHPAHIAAPPMLCRNIMVAMLYSGQPATVSRRLHGVTTAEVLICSSNMQCPSNNHIYTLNTRKSMRREASHCEPLKYSTLDLTMRHVADQLTYSAASFGTTRHYYTQHSTNERMRRRSCCARSTVQCTQNLATLRKTAQHLIIHGSLINS